jgi:S1-C subfamily serine protease
MITNRLKKLLYLSVLLALVATGSGITSIYPYSPAYGNQYILPYSQKSLQVSLQNPAQITNASNTYSSSFELQDSIALENNLDVQTNIDGFDTTSPAEVLSSDMIIPDYENTVEIKKASVLNGEYTGEMVNGYYNGFGTFIWHDGDKYTGTWLNSMMHGQGTYIWNSGDRYYGDWEYGNITGYGTYVFRDGSKYVGQWENGIMTGQGVFVHANGNSFIGIWNNSPLFGNNQGSMLTLVSTPSVSKKEIIKQQASVVLIECYDRYKRLISTGSGFVVSDSGIVATNYHVIQKASSIIIIKHDGTKYDVSKIIEYDSKRDIALLQAKNLDDMAPVLLGDSSKVDIGDDTIAIGSPYGLQNTISDGIISGWRNFEGYDFIQTTASISPGSSGGALFNMNGEVIGITSSKITNGENLNFAIPINDMKAMFNKHLK